MTGGIGETPTRAHSETSEPLFQVNKGITEAIKKLMGDPEKKDYVKRNISFNLLCYNKNIPETDNQEII